MKNSTGTSDSQCIKSASILAGTDTINSLQEESLHTPRLHNRREAIPLQAELIHQTNIMVVVRQISTTPRQVAQPTQIHCDILRKMRCIDNRHSNGAIAVDERRDVNVLSVAARIYTHGARTCEAEVASECPKTSGSVVRVTVETDQSVVASCVLRAPPVGVAGGRGAGKSVVHVNCPLEAFAGRMLGVSAMFMADRDSAKRLTYASWPVTSQLPFQSPVPYGQRQFRSAYNAPTESLRLPILSRGSVGPEY